MKLLWMVAGIALASATVATAADEESEDPGAKVVCKTEKVTGSRTKTKRTCMTQKEWDELASQSRQGMDRINSQAGVNRGSSQVLPGGN
jgi:hypothetical protein